MPYVPPEFIDITHWNLSEQGQTGAMYGEGALSKFLLKDGGGQQWMFKETWHRVKESKGYDNERPYQYWSEIIAYLLSPYMGVSVPETHIGYHQQSLGDVTFIVGVLSKWFLSDSIVFHRGSEILQYYPLAEGEKVYTENDCHFQLAIDSSVLVALHNCLDADKELSLVLLHWTKMTVFDIVLGNQDRHHENWGMLSHLMGIDMSPVYDNGASLGFTVMDETAIDSLEKRNAMIEKMWQGYKYKYKASPDLSKKTIDIISVLKERGGEKQEMLDCLAGITYENLQEIKNSAIILNQKVLEKSRTDTTLAPYVLSDNRLEFMLNSIAYRAEKLKELIHELYQ